MLTVVVNQRARVCLADVFVAINRVHVLILELFSSEHVELNPGALGTSEIELLR